MTLLKIIRRTLFIICVLYIFGCASQLKTPYSPTALEEVPFIDRAQTQNRAGLTITVSVLSPTESQQIFGIDLESKGIQPVWFNIRNDSDKSYVFLPITVDSSYYSPGEVSFMFKGNFSKSDYIKMDEYLEKLNMNNILVRPNEDSLGFVYTKLDPGVKYVNVALYSPNELQDFDFFFTVPGITTPADTVDFDSIYDEKEIVYYEREYKLRTALESLACCTTDRDGNGEGFPLNFVFIGHREALEAALIYQGWDVAETVPEYTKAVETNLFSTGRYRTTPLSDFYFYGRRQDVGLQKARLTRRGNLRQRIEMRLWLSPMRFQGKEVWVGSVSTDVGSKIKFKNLKIIEEKEIDSDMDEAREYLLEDMVLSGNVSKIGRVEGIEPADRFNPHINYLDLAWWTDGYRVVLLFQEHPLSLNQLEFFPWYELNDTDYEMQNIRIKSLLENLE